MAKTTRTSKSEVEETEKDSEQEQEQKVRRVRFKKDEIDKLNAEKDSYKKPEIPSGAICEFMVLDIGFSENAQKTAEQEDRNLSFVHDSFTMRLAITGYLKTFPPEDKRKPEWIKLIEYKDEVTILEPEMYLKSFVVLNKYFLNNCKIKAPSNEPSAVLRFATALEASFGIEYDTAVNLLIMIAEDNDVQVGFEDVGVTSIKKPIWETICFLSYYKKYKTDKGDWKTVIGLYDKEAPLDPKVDIYDGEISVELNTQLIEITEKAKANKKDSSDKPF